MRYKAWTKETFFANTIRDPNDPDSCWIWAGSKSGFGRNLRGFTSYQGKMMQATKAACLISGKKIPKGKQRNHTCNVSICIRPSHIYAGTHLQNVQDRVEIYAPTLQRNEETKIARSIYTRKPWMVGNVFDLWNSERFSEREIASIFSMTTSGVSRILNRNRVAYASSRLEAGGYRQKDGSLSNRRSAELEAISKSSK